MDEILRKTSTEGDACDSVLESEMADILSITPNNKGIATLKLGDFDNLDRVSRVELVGNELTELPAGIFSPLQILATLALNDNAFTALRPLQVYGTPFLLSLLLSRNQLNALPAGLFSGQTNQLAQLWLDGNPGAPFQLTVKFELQTLEENFDAAPVRVVLREGAPLDITVPLSVTGGSLIAGAPDSLTIATGSTQSASVTIIRAGDGYFRLAQGDLGFSGRLDAYLGVNIVRGPAITFGGIRVKARVFLEGALE